MGRGGCKQYNDIISLARRGLVIKIRCYTEGINNLITFGGVWTNVSLLLEGAKGRGPNAREKERKKQEEIH